MPLKLRNFAKKIAMSIVYSFPRRPYKIHGRRVWLHPRAWFSLSRKFFFERENHVRIWLSERLKPGDVFFDVGAHHGWISMWSLPVVGDAGAVYSFEPSPVNLSILEWHRTNNDFSQWTIVPKAVSDEDSQEEQFFLIDSGDSPMNSLTSGIPGSSQMEGRDVRKVSIQTITLDTFCNESRARPNLVKIDVEGAELLVLRGAEKLLSESCPVIILAVHPYWLPPGQSSQQIVEFMQSHNYTVFNSKGESVTSLRHGEYLCLTPSSQMSG